MTIMSEIEQKSEFRKIIDIDDSVPLTAKQCNLLRVMIANKQNLSEDKDIFLVDNNRNRSIQFFCHTTNRSSKLNGIKSYLKTQS